MVLTKEPFGLVGDIPVHIWTFDNKAGTQVRITNYGATITNIRTPDRDGKVEDVLCGYDTLEGCLSDKAYFGCVVGRVAGRISKAAFTLNGTAYQLAANEPPNHIHGGVEGFNSKVWTAEELQDHPDGDALRLSYVSPDMEEGFPGELTLVVTYSLNTAGQLRIQYYATTTKDTILVPTNHAYFNLGGHKRGDVLGHVMKLEADQYLPMDNAYIPTGELAIVKGTPYDFTEPIAVGTHLQHEDVKRTNGYAHTMVIRPSASAADARIPRLAGTVQDPDSGRSMKVFTTEPGVVFYNAFNLHNVKGKDDAVYMPSAAFCLEAQNYPDASSHDHFPSPVLREAAEFHATTIYQFYTA
eukprot:NODE_3376_length_1230_cov_130.004517_g3205_i0.p1 GENE.NODE_3376_length_1230_cov_130.004517_g3205_i0~~NODE_3376_length_1230_cov_130.004517_g3205_i0.p1  ORF type:complete len:380 (+),score=88.94 NODE_3376_length_1230_cov_130.004517_g3205_i0:78-1142(+)